MCACTHIHGGGQEMGCNQDFHSISGHFGRFKLVWSPLSVLTIHLSPRTELQNPWSCRHIWMDLKEYPCRRTFTLTGGSFGIVINQKRYFRTGTQIISPAEHQPLGLEASRKAGRALIKAKENKQVKKNVLSKHIARRKAQPHVQILGKQNLTLNIAVLPSQQHHFMFCKQSCLLFFLLSLPPSSVT